MEARARVEPAWGRRLRSMDAFSTSCSARPTTSAGSRPARSPAPRSTRACPSARTRPPASTPRWSPSTRRPASACHFLAARSGPALPGVRARLEHQPGDGPIVTQPPVVAPRRVRAGHPLLPGGRDPDPRHGHGGGLRGRRLHDRRARRRRHRHGRGADPGAGGPAGRRLARGRRLGGARGAHSAALPTHRRARLHARREAGGGVRRAVGERLRALAGGQGRGDRARHAWRRRSSSA